METPKTLHFKVVGDHLMHCGGCANAVEFGLRQLEGVSDVTADHERQTIEMRADLQASNLAVIREQIDFLGYQVEEIGSAGEGSAPASNAPA